MVQLLNFFFFITSMVVPRGTAAPVLFQWFVSRDVPTGAPSSNGTLIPILIPEFPFLVYLHSRKFIRSMDRAKSGVLVRASRPIRFKDIIGRSSSARNALFCFVLVLHFLIMGDLSASYFESFCGLSCLQFFCTIFSLPRDRSAKRERRRKRQTLRPNGNEQRRNDKPTERCPYIAYIERRVEGFGPFPVPPSPYGSPTDPELDSQSSSSGRLRPLRYRSGTRPGTRLAKLVLRSPAATSPLLSVEPSLRYGSMSRGDPEASGNSAFGGSDASTTRGGSASLSLGNSIRKLIASSMGRVDEIAGPIGDEPMSKVSQGSGAKGAGSPGYEAKGLAQGERSEDPAGIGEHIEIGGPSSSGAGPEIGLEALALPTSRLLMAVGHDYYNKVKIHLPISHGGVCIFLLGVLLSCDPVADVRPVAHASSF